MDAGVVTALITATATVSAVLIPTVASAISARTDRAAAITESQLIERLRDDSESAEILRTVRRQLLHRTEKWNRRLGRVPFWRTVAFSTIMTCAATAILFFILFYPMSIPVAGMGDMTLEQYYEVIDPSGKLRSLLKVALIACGGLYISAAVIYFKALDK